MVTATPAETTLRRVSLADAAYDVLQQAILRGELPPGEELSAVALAERYRVSRTPITEALQRLTHDGLVLQEPHRQPRGVKLERSDVVEIYEMRAQLEAAAAERAASRISPAVCEALDSVNVADQSQGVADAGAVDRTVQLGLGAILHQGVVGLEVACLALLEGGDVCDVGMDQGTDGIAPDRARDGLARSGD